MNYFELIGHNFLCTFVKNCKLLLFLLQQIIMVITKPSYFHFVM